MHLCNYFINNVKITYYFIYIHFYIVNYSMKQDGFNYLHRQRSHGYTLANKFLLISIMRFRMLFIMYIGYDPFRKF